MKRLNDRRELVPRGYPRRLFLCGGIIVGIFAFTAVANADVPQCTGNDSVRAASARADGLTHYRASKHLGAGDADMAAALDSFNQACAAGDDTALELRAYALAGLYKYVDAAQSLDAYLVAHPLDSLDADTRARVTSQQAEILSHVATLDVASTPPGAEISIDHFSLGKAPLHGVRLAPGNYEIEASQPDSAPQAHHVDLALGQHSETFDFSTPTLIETSTQPAPLTPPPPETKSGSLRPWAWGAAAGAGVGVVVGVVGLVYANGRANAYNDFRGTPDANGNAPYCSSNPSPGDCSSIKSQYGVGRTLAVFGFIGAGIFGAAAASLFYLDATSHHAASADRGSTGKITVSCGPWLGAGASCAGVF
jgi:hypothetical protein